MGIFDGKIVRASNQRDSVTKELLDHMIDEESEIVTLIWGEDVNEEEVEELRLYIEENHAGIEVEDHHGRQPLYSYLISVE